MTIDRLISNLSSISIEYWHMDWFTIFFQNFTGTEFFFKYNIFCQSQIFVPHINHLNISNPTRALENRFQNFPIAFPTAAPANQKYYCQTFYRNSSAFTRNNLNHTRHRKSNGKKAFGTFIYIFIYEYVRYIAVDSMACRTRYQIVFVLWVCAESIPLG